MSRWIADHAVLRAAVLGAAMLGAVGCARKAQDDTPTATAAPGAPTAKGTPVAPGSVSDAGGAPVRPGSTPTTDDHAAVRALYEKVAEAMKRFDGAAMDALVHPRDRSAFRAISFVQAVHAMTGTVEFLAQQAPERASRVNDKLVELLAAVEVGHSATELLSLSVADAAKLVGPATDEVTTTLVYQAMRLAFDEAEAVLGDLPPSFGPYVDSKITGDAALISYRATDDSPPFPMAAVRVEGSWYYDAAGTLAALDALIAGQ